MNELRLILLLVGAVILVAVYLYSRRSIANRHSRKLDPKVGEREGTDDFPEDLPPMSAVEMDETEDDHALKGRSAEADQNPPLAKERQETIIVLNILPITPGDSFPGADLLDVFDRAGLEYGQFDVFHRIRETGDGPQSVFSVASATEPGSFDITTMADLGFRGLTLFMVLPGPMRGVDGFADMLATARRIAEQIRGEVKDRNRSTLTRQTAHHIREEIIAFEHRLQLES